MERQCKVCGESKDTVQGFHAYRPRVCKKCHSKQSQVSKQKKINVNLQQLQRVCSNCNETKNKSEFYPGVLTNHCKKCHTLKSNAHIKAERERLKEIARQHEGYMAQREQEREAYIKSLEEQIRLLKLNSKEERK